MTKYINPTTLIANCSCSIRDLTYNGITAVYTGAFINLPTLQALFDHNIAVILFQFTVVTINFRLLSYNPITYIAPASFASMPALVTLYEI